MEPSLLDGDRGARRSVLEVLRPGLYTTVQDLGRPGYRRWGLPVGGALDKTAFRLANHLVGNEPNAAGLELTVRGPTLRVLSDSIVAVTGADMGFTVNGQTAPQWEAILVTAGATLAFTRPAGGGIRAYLAVFGGVDVPVVLGSRSTYARARLGGLQGRALAAGDRLSSRPSPEACPTGLVGRRLPSALWPRRSTLPVRIILGPQADHFSRRGLNTLLSGAYRVLPASDRMGSRLHGTPIDSTGNEFVSDGMIPGSIQVTTAGLPIISLWDGPTTGGYPKIGTVIQADLDHVAQAAPGDLVRFRRVTIRHAQQIYRESLARIQQLVQAIDRISAGRDIWVAALRSVYRVRLETDVSDVVGDVQEGERSREADHWNDLWSRRGRQVGPVLRLDGLCTSH